MNHMREEPRGRPGRSHLARPSFRPLRVTAFRCLFFIAWTVCAPTACVVSTTPLEGEQGPQGETGEPGEPGDQPFGYSPDSQDVYYDQGNLIIGSTALGPETFNFFPIVDIIGTRGTLSLRTTEPTGISTLRLTGPGANHVDDWHINATAGENSTLAVHPKGQSLPALTITNAGDIGIGTPTPNYRLHVMGTSDSPTVVLTNAGNGPALDVGSAGMRTQGSAYLALDGDAKVGIGTAFPQATLDVNGTMRLAKHSSAPFPCDAAHDATIALTSQYSMCVCNGPQAKWAPTANPGGTCLWQ